MIPTVPNTAWSSVLLHILSSVATAADLVFRRECPVDNIYDTTAGKLGFTVQEMLYKSLSLCAEKPVILQNGISRHTARISAKTSPRFATAVAHAIPALPDSLRLVPSSGIIFLHNLLPLCFRAFCKATQCSASWQSWRFAPLIVHHPCSLDLNKFQETSNMFVYMPFQVSHAGIGPDNLRYNFNMVRLEKWRKALGSRFTHIYFQASTEITLFGTEVLSKKPHFSSTMSEIQPTERRLACISFVSSSHRS